MFNRNPSTPVKESLANSERDGGKKESKSIVMVGSPNVGKSLLFNQLSGTYVTVSNYPGTTVTIDSGKCNIDGENFHLMDSPGMYSLNSITEEENISKLILLKETPENDSILSMINPLFDTAIPKIEQMGVDIEDRMD